MDRPLSRRACPLRRLAPSAGSEPSRPCPIARARAVVRDPPVLLGRRVSAVDRPLSSGAGPHQRPAPSAGSVLSRPCPTARAWVVVTTGQRPARSFRARVSAVDLPLSWVVVTTGQRPARSFRARGLSGGPAIISRGLSTSTVCPSLLTTMPYSAGSDRRQRPAR